MWVLTAFLLLQLIYWPSSTPILNRVDTHALAAIIINLNAYLLLLPEAQLLEPGGRAAYFLEVGILTIQASVAVHFVVGFGLGFHQIVMKLRQLQSQVQETLSHWHNPRDHRVSIDSVDAEPEEVGSVHSTVTGIAGARATSAGSVVSVVLSGIAHPPHHRMRPAEAGLCGCGHASRRSAPLTSAMTRSVWCFWLLPPKTPTRHTRTHLHTRNSVSGLPGGCRSICQSVCLSVSQL